MARITINNNSVEPLGGPNLGVSTEQGDSWNTTVANLNTMFTEIYSGTMAVSGNKTFSGNNAFTGANTFQAGSAASATFVPSGNITKLAATVNSGNTNTTQTLVSYTVPANTLNTAGQELMVTSWGTVANNAAPKTIALNIGGAFITTGTVTGAAFSWELSGNYVATSATAENYWLSGFGSGTSPLANKAGTDSATISGTFAISVTCADASAASSDVSLLGFSVEYLG